MDNYLLAVLAVMSETPFRLALVVVFALTMSVTVYHRLQAARSGERISHAAEGWPMFWTLRLSGLALWAFVLAWLVAPDSMAWARVPLPSWLRWIGMAIGICMCAPMYWTLRNLGTNLTDTVITRRDHTLITTGPYRWVRHPFYLTAAGLFLSATLVSANAAIAVAAVIVLMLLAVRTPKEEQRLIERFGDDYRQYAARTGRFWPRWR